MKCAQWFAVAALTSVLSAGGAAWAAENAEAAGPIKVGCIFSVTGPASYLGAPEKKTAEMLVEKINAAGGVLGRKIQLIVKDSEGSTEKATSFAKQLIDEDGVLAIIGPSTSGESLAIKKHLRGGEDGSHLLRRGRERSWTRWRRTSSSPRRRTATPRSGSSRR